MERKGKAHKEPNLHEGHRARLRKRIRNEGLEGLDDHQVLEYVLMLTIPRRDTNELAHTLLRRFGSLSSVFDALPTALEKVRGVSECTSTLLWVFPQLMRRYLLDKETRYPDFGDFRRLGSYLTGYYFGLSRERVAVILLNNRAQMIKIVPISEGTVNESEFSLRKIIELALENQASSVVLAHNHPDGSITPSEEDIRMTRRCEKTLAEVGIPLAEHVIVAGDAYYGILSGDGASDRESLLKGLLKEKED